METIKTTTTTTTNSTQSFLRGTIVQRRKFRTNVSLAIKPTSSITMTTTTSPTITLQGRLNNRPILFLLPRTESCLEYCFVGAFVEVKYNDPEKNDNDDVNNAVDSIKKQQSSHIHAVDIKLIYCSPDPNVIVTCLELAIMIEEKVSLDVFCSPNILYNNKKQIRQGILNISPRNPERREIILQISRNIQKQMLKHFVTNNNNNNDIASKKYGMSKPRKAHIKRQDWNILHWLEMIAPTIEIYNTKTTHAVSTTTTSPTFHQNGYNIAELNKQLELARISTSTTTSSSSSCTDTLDDNKEPMSATSSNDITTVVGTNADGISDAKTTASMLINVPNIHSMSCRHPISRADYLKDKKWPQIQWLIQKLQYMIEQKTARIENGERNNEQQQRQQLQYQNKFRIVDVGGGRGDIAVAIIQVFDNVHVTVVDMNESSLQAGKTYAETVLGKHDANERITFHNDNFVHFTQQQQQQQHIIVQNTTTTSTIRSDTNNHSSSSSSSTCYNNDYYDIVVAWHACGDLSDCALEYAIATNASFIVCPCCYTKRYIDDFVPKWIQDYIHDSNEEGKMMNNGNGTCYESVTDQQLKEDVVAALPLENHITTILRLAETNSRRDVARRAMVVVNTMRLFSLKHWHYKKKYGNKNHHGNGIVSSDDKNNNKLIWLEEYNVEHSAKNLVLLGI